MIAFAQMMDQHLHAFPDMWWNWLDKRWNRILRTSPGADGAQSTVSAINPPQAQ
jgi:hypothetical protein